HSKIMPWLRFAVLRLCVKISAQMSSKKSANPTAASLKNRNVPKTRGPLYQQVARTCQLPNVTQPDAAINSRMTHLRIGAKMLAEVNSAGLSRCATAVTPRKAQQFKGTMTKIKLLMASLIATSLTFTAAFAADKDKDITITGDGQCAKCSLKETSKCQNAIKTADGKTYYLADNKVSKSFHEEVCKETKK